MKKTSQKPNIASLLNKLRIQSDEIKKLKEELLNLEFEAFLLKFKSRV
jgi:hypothetical protein